MSHDLETPPPRASEPFAALPAIGPARAAATVTRAVTLLSYGFKYGRPPANHSFDVSFVANPARDARWTLFSQPDEEMRAFVLDQPATEEFLSAAAPLVRILASADDDARVALGCSSGRHRSPILAEELARRLRADGMRVRVEHREGALP